MECAGPNSRRRHRRHPRGRSRGSAQVRMGKDPGGPGTGRECCPAAPVPARREGPPRPPNTRYTTGEVSRHEFATMRIWGSGTRLWHTRVMCRPGPCGGSARGISGAQPPAGTAFCSWGMWSSSRKPVVSGSRTGGAVTPRRAGTPRRAATQACPLRRPLDPVCIWRCCASFRAAARSCGRRRRTRPPIPYGSSCAGRRAARAPETFRPEVRGILKTACHAPNGVGLPIR